MINQTVTADVEDCLDSLPDGAARMIVTSIPYNVGKTYGDAAGADRLRHVAYIGWLLKILSECARILSDGGTLFLQVGSTRDDDDRLIPLDTLLFEWIRKTGLDFQSRVIWTIPHGLTPRRRLAERHETALVFSKGTPIFNPGAARQPQKQPGKRAFKGPARGQLSGHPLGAWPTNVWSDIGNVGHNNPERTGHPAQFPLALARRAIQLYSMPGDVICDPFSGAGTTQVAALQTGRAFTGCDLFYEDVRARRLAGVQPDRQSPLPGVSDQSVAVWQAEARRVDHPATPIADSQSELLI
jgi:DNA modification methylase